MFCSVHSVSVCVWCFSKASLLLFTYIAQSIFLSVSLSLRSLRSTVSLCRSVGLIVPLPQYVHLHPCVRACVRVCVCAFEIVLSIICSNAVLTKCLLIIKQINHCIINHTHPIVFFIFSLPFALDFSPSIRLIYYLLIRFKSVSYAVRFPCEKGAMPFHILLIIFKSEMSVVRHSILLILGCVWCNSYQCIVN